MVKVERSFPAPDSLAEEAKKKQMVSVTSQM